MKSLRVLLVTIGIGAAVVITFALQQEWGIAVKYNHVNFKKGKYRLHVSSVGIWHSDSVLLVVFLCRGFAV